MITLWLPRTRLPDEDYSIILWPQVNNFTCSGDCQGVVNAVSAELYLWPSCLNTLRSSDWLRTLDRQRHLSMRSLGPPSILLLSIRIWDLSRPRDETQTVQGQSGSSFRCHATMSMRCVEHACHGEDEETNCTHQCSIARTGICAL